MHKFLSRSLLACTFLWSAMSCAQDQNYLTNPGAVAVMDELVSEEGFDRQSLEAIFADASRQQSILDAMARPAEKTKAWYEYREIFLNDKREAQGVAFYQEHRETLERVEQETGVPAEIIVAIIGVETYYGRIAGSYRVIDALSTLAFDYPRRSEFFTKELKHYLILTRDQGMDPLALKGSYAGAMGYGQFMPSSYRSYAIDFDGDSKADIWSNPVDAIGSVANYFKAHGWTPGAEVVVAAELEGEVPEEMMSRGRQLKPRFTVAEFVAAGLVPATETDPDAEAIGIEFELADGREFWLGLHNFYVITRYNHSAMYAMSVYQLSQRIAAGVEG
ncbi:lytic murein transglycosylase B [Seongchinamella unica]|uniref:Lytic murein transglycosylase B n=1 Tax=Seongchinamella unica TaxID=2547392 RepID=A0A4R5LPY5_9GAMM|nr:lytic murein transglycosylase B [Seongchinamella unica]TDG12515.1 lytic murein transglycosylase B [Seongchinamella unica]